MTTLLLSTRTSKIPVKRIINDITKFMDVELEPNFDLRKQANKIESLMDVYDCQSTMYFECTKRFQRLWIANNNYSVRFEITDMTNIFDLRTIINCHVEGGHKLCFSSDFDENENLKIIKDLFTINFELKRPVERALCFFTDGSNIFIRNYLIEGMGEIGPRFNLKIDKILKGCFQGECLYNIRDDKNIENNDEENISEDEIKND